VHSSASTLVVGDLGQSWMGKFFFREFHIRCIARDLFVVDSETVTLGIGINEETRLEEGIGGRLNVRNQVRR